MPSARAILVATRPARRAPPLWDGHAGERIAEVDRHVARARRDRRPAEVAAGRVTGTGVAAILRKQHTVRGAVRRAYPTRRVPRPGRDPFLEDP